jgi:hypothetical protein
MPRPKSDRHSSDLDAEIARLEQERKRLIQSEDQRRGAIIRDLLAGANGSALRALLQPLIGTRDAFLFGFATPVVDSSQGDVRPATSRRRTGEAAGRHRIETSATA